MKSFLTRKSLRFQKVKNGVVVLSVAMLMSACGESSAPASSLVSSTTASISDVSSSSEPASSTAVESKDSSDNATSNSDDIVTIFLPGSINSLSDFTDENLFQWKMTDIKRGSDGSITAQMKSEDHRELFIKISELTSNPEMYKSFKELYGLDVTEMTYNDDFTKVTFKTNDNTYSREKIMNIFLDTPYFVMCLNAKKQAEVDIDVINSDTGELIETIHFPDPNDLIVSGQLGEFAVAIKGARLAKDFEGNKSIIVSMDFTNNSTEGQIFSASILNKAFQNGIQLETAVVLDLSNNSLKEIKPGVTLEIETAYKLDDLEQPVDIEVSNVFSFDDAKVIKTFDIQQLQG